MSACLLQNVRPPSDVEEVRCSSRCLCARNAPVHFHLEGNDRHWILFAGRRTKGRGLGWAETAGLGIMTDVANLQVREISTRVVLRRLY